MLKRTFGNILTTLGAPAGIGVWVSMGSVSLGGNPLHLLWSVPLSIVSLPLLPLYLEGEKLLSQCDVEDFQEQTKHLPRVADPQDALYIEPTDDGKFLIGPLYDEDPFNSMMDARSFLQALGYQEVIDSDNPHPHLWGTIWVKLNETKGNNNGVRH